MDQPWSTTEQQRLKELRVDPVQNSRLKLVGLVTHFKGPRPSVFAVTEGGVEPKVSKGLARKVKSLTGDGKMDWLLGSKGSVNELLVMRKPSTPAQEEALELCNQGDHSWIHAARFRDHGFSEAYRVEDSQETDQDPPDETKRPISRTTLTCYFCGFEVLMRGWAVI